MGWVWGCRPLERDSPWSLHPQAPAQAESTPAQTNTSLPRPCTHQHASPLHWYSNRKAKAARNRGFLQIFVSVLSLGQDR